MADTLSISPEEPVMPTATCVVESSPLEDPMQLQTGAEMPCQTEAPCPEEQLPSADNPLITEAQAQCEPPVTSPQPEEECQLGATSEAQ